MRFSIGLPGLDRYPGPHPPLWSFCGVPAAETRRMIGENAIELYNLDAAALLRVAQEISAPTVEELATPIDAVPEGASVTAFRSGAGGWS